MTFLEGYLTLDLYSEGIFHGIGIFCRFFALKDFLRNRPLKKVWADRPTAVRFRVKRVQPSVSALLGFVMDLPLCTLFYRGTRVSYSFIFKVHAIYLP